MRRLRALLGIFPLLLATPLLAQQSSTWKISGFGGYGYGDTDGNAYLAAGDYAALSMALGFTAQPIPSLTIAAQGEGHYAHGETERELDFALAEWRFSDAFRVRGGRVKHAFGLYTEIFHVGTLRPFFTLPMSIYGQSGFVAEGVLGAGVTGARYGERWGVEYDAYYGEINVLDDQRSDFFLHHEEEGEEEEEEEHGHAGRELRGLVGGRVSVVTPVSGLRVGASSYSGTEEHEDGTERNTVLASHVEYLSGAWMVRSELARSARGEDAVSTGFYTEVARTWAGRVQTAARYDRSRTDLGFGITEGASLLEHDELATGVSYWFSPRLVGKVSYHHVLGNRFAAPVDDHSWDALIESDRLARRTNEVLVGVQLSF